MTTKPLSEDELGIAADFSDGTDVTPTKRLKELFAELKTTINKGVKVFDGKKFVYDDVSWIKIEELFAPLMPKDEVKKE